MVMPLALNGTKAIIGSGHDIEPWARIVMPLGFNETNISNWLWAQV
jgi:hypothetical protein